MKPKFKMFLVVCACVAFAAATVSTGKYASAEERAIIIIVPSDAKPRKLTIQERVAKSVAAAKLAGNRAVRQHNMRKLYKLRSKRR